MSSKTGRLPLVSVVVPAFNNAPYIGAAIESIDAQNYQPLEIIVVDDGSTDDTEQAVCSFRHVQYIRQENAGPARARNVGIQKSHGEFVAFLDADDLWTAGKLSTQLDILNKHPDAALVFGDMKGFGVGIGAEPTMYEKYALGENYFGPGGLVIQAVQKLLKMNFIPTGTVVARRHAIIDAGLFDESLKVVEDWDLWLRIALRHPIAYAGHVVMLRRLHGANTSKQTEAMSIAALKVIEKLGANEGAALQRASADVNCHLRDGYRNLGYYYLRQLALQQARAAFLRSLSFGLHWRTSIYLASTFLGAGLVRSMMRARR
ncbi:MAG TPA: glycosyltransferase family A protein [Candidatus Binatus sp.]|nr:glycosyltransferase family A protein [Candidatus Binatus sp.]